MRPRSTPAPGSIPSAPFFEDLRAGLRADEAPSVTLTSGLAAVHQAIVGDRLRLPLDATLSARVLPGGGAPAHPALVWDVAIGQSTLITQRVVANLFYRRLVLLRAPLIGDTLTTSTEVVALRENRLRPGRARTGLAVLRIRTTDQEKRPVLDFWRCAMLPLRGDAAPTGHADDLDAIPAALDGTSLHGAIAGWRLDAFRLAVPGAHFEDVGEGTVWMPPGGDVVSSAPELARATLNVAMTHHDRLSGSTGRRLVYGGHTIGIAASQAARALPTLVTIVAWHRCDHLAPVYEGDTLYSELTLERAEPLPSGGGLVHLRSSVRAIGDDGARDVLDWRFAGVLA